MGGDSMKEMRTARGALGVAASCLDLGATRLYAKLELWRRDLAKHLFEIGGVACLKRTLLDHGRSGCGGLTVRGRAVGGRVRQERNGDQCVVHPEGKPFAVISGALGLQGNLAPVGAIVKVAGMAGLKLTEPARFDGEEACLRQVKNKKYREGEVLVIRNERPLHGLGMREALAIREAVALLFLNGSLFAARPCVAIFRAIGGRQCRPAFRCAHAGYRTCHAEV